MISPRKKSVTANKMKTGLGQKMTNPEDHGCVLKNLPEAQCNRKRLSPDPKRRQKDERAERSGTFKQPIRKLGLAMVAPFTPGRGHCNSLSTFCLFSVESISSGRTGKPHRRRNKFGFGFRGRAISLS